MKRWITVVSLAALTLAYLTGRAAGLADQTTAQQAGTARPARPGNWTKVPLAPDQGGVVYVSADDLQKAHATLSGAGASGTSNLVELPITHTHAYNFVHRSPRPTPAGVECHDGVTDIYLIVGGTGTIVVGGEIESREPVANVPGEYRGLSIKGGRDYKVKAGDILRIPPSTAHQSFPDPGGFTYLLLKVNVGMYPWSIVATQQNTLPATAAHPRKLAALGPDEGGIVYWSSNDLQAAHRSMASAVASGQTPDPRDFVELPITRTHAFNFLYRTMRNGRLPGVEFHEGNTDIYFIVAGSGAVRVGGEIEDRQPAPNMPGEYRGPSIKNGRDYAVKAGDVLSIPPSTPHQSLPGPEGFTYMLVKVNVGMYPWSLVAGQR